MGACSDDPPAGVDGESDAGGKNVPDGSTGNDGKDSAPADAEPDRDGAITDGASDACPVPAVPSLDAGGGCGTMEFGAIAAPFGDVDGGAAYQGGVLSAGVYDAVVAERLSAKGSWRETFVVDGVGHFTRIRQIDTGLSDASLGPVTRRSGTYTTNGTEITLTYDCAMTNDAAVDAGSDTLPYEALTDSTCGTVYRYGATGIRITLKRR